MKIPAILITALLIFSSSAHARDDHFMLPLKDVLARASAEHMINDSVKYFFGKTKHPKVKTNFGEASTNKKTNAFNKTDVEACQWAFLSAIKQLHTKAISLGANAVVNIRSNYKNNLISSETQYECGAGTFVAGVALKADFVKI
ncbi:Excinuclease ATPase subunit [hydrothermal vent metagenome]|uniref:Excinuclease ATPase subunit n=1 Tax=hydrothermal vent metagenome TaxID=652676 RepID=A0A3B0XQM3_9ZZZZ